MGIFAMEKLNGLCTFIEISEPDLSDDDIDCEVDASTVEGNLGGDMYPQIFFLGPMMHKYSLSLNDMM